MRDARCAMRNAQCAMRNAQCAMRDALCAGVPHGWALCSLCALHFALCDCKFEYFAGLQWQGNI
jgi:hypothetical protein